MEQINSLQATQENKISVGGHINTYINFAMQQNYVPIIRNIIIKNEQDKPLNNITVKVNFEPNFAQEFTYNIECIEAGKTVEISPVSISLSTEFLFSLTEKMVGSVVVSVYANEEKTNVNENNTNAMENSTYTTTAKLYEYRENVELLTYDQWTGLSFMPEFISAFITPNHPVINDIIKIGAKYLAQWGKQPLFTGYQTNNPNNVKLQMAALYAALMESQIMYNNPPASYEVVGQRVRMPHKVMETKEGTCLDLAVLYTACLEAVGLNPLLVFKKGHAFAGCHLEQETFADVCEDDLSSIEKRVVKGSEELLLVECTDFVVGKNIDFELALKHGLDHLIMREEFICAVDVKRTRGSGIRPIPVLVQSARMEQSASMNQNSMNGQSADMNQNSQMNPTAGIGGDNQIFAEFNSEYIAPPSELVIREMADLPETEQNITKQRVWERKLLDFSLRNSLLNFRATKNSFQIITADLASLEDKLADGKSFKVMEIPSDWTIPVRDAKMYEIENHRDLLNAIAEEEFKNNRIRTFMTPEELTVSLKSIYRAAKVSIEENGTNTLFLALGFLRWYESDLSEKPRYAPIVLVPIEIVKSIKNGGYVIRSRQEDAQINITLLEYLRQIFGIKINGLDPLPADEHGIDMQLIFHTIRKAIMDKKNWNIEDIAYVGLFSFGQFVMWNDIRNRADELAQNKVVSSLIDGKLTWEPKETPVTLEELDTKLKPEMMAVPLSADSSQMVAITRAANGESFVLHGPPGTGKSQTITNMIANALYQGKSVLFVAEKMAALNVVKKRLTGIGLAPFCLEIHSNKSSKSSVLTQLNNALEVGRIKAPGEYEATASKLYELRCKLNDVIEAIHEKRAYGKSLYEIVGVFEDTKDYKGKIQLPQEMEGSVAANVDAWLEAIREYAVALNDVGSFEANPLKGYKGTSYTIELREQFGKDIDDILGKISVARDSFNKLTSWANMPEYQDRVAVDEFIAIESLLQDNSPVLRKLIFADSFEGLSAQISAAAQDGMAFNNLDFELKNNFEESVFTFNVNEAMLEYKKAELSWFIPEWINKNKLKKELMIHAKNPSIVTKANLYSYYEKISNHLKLNINVSQISDEVKDTLGDLFKEKATDWQLVLNALNKASLVRAFLGNVAAEKREKYVQVLEIYNGLNSGNLAGEATQTNTSTILESIAQLKSFDMELSSFANKYTIDISDMASQADWYGELAKRAGGYRENIGLLKNWITMQQKAAKLSELGIAYIHTAWEQGDVNGENVLDAFVCNLYYLFMLKTIRDDGRLAQFQGKQYEDMINMYSEFVEEYKNITIKELVARLSANVPASNGAVVATSELGILKKAIKSNGRMLSIRKLFDEIPTLLRKICPCMLMSPISVAQYIDPTFPKFDLVIFDEASQIPTSSAVGTIARGENVVVVGDPKQLPPTSFFNANRVDEDNMEKEDLESLLDDCLSISMPQEYLKWHYRSRHESLITYSNIQYYENKLYTFPSPSDMVSAVEYVPVEGFYDKGKTKHNVAEAKAVVAEIIRRLSDKELREESIGVVTFSSVQQNLIDDLLSVEWAKHPELEEYDRNSKEPLFIKNLENVQGDERDVILFSIGYGPDKDGKVSMNFGPLNRDGGWRRLNVAISRARKNMIVYSTLRPEHIDLSRTRAEGVAGLKGFLEFAMRGKNALVQKSSNAVINKDKFAYSLANAIRELGYEVEANIGSSEFKMDIGIVDNENPGKYLLGILLDGDNCKATPTAKDRFVSIPGVLEGLGWEIMRVWVLEWIDEPNKVLDEIKARVEKVKELAKAAEQEAAENEQTENGSNENALNENEPVEVVENEVIQDEVIQDEVVEVTDNDASVVTESEMSKELSSNVAGEDAALEIKQRESSAELSVEEASEKEALTEIEVSVEITEKKDAESNNNTITIGGIVFEKDDSAIETAAIPYESYEIQKTYEPEFFYEPEAMSVIVALAKNMLVTEAPISKKALYRKLLAAFGIARLGSRLETVLDNAMLKVEKKETIENGNIFYWLLEQDPDDYVGYRVEMNEENTKRSMDDIVSVEIINALTEVLGEQISLPKEDLIRETAKKFGYTRLGTIIDAAVSYAIEVAISKKIIAVNEMGRYEEA